MTREKNICFVGLDSYPILNPEFGNESFGGESVQQTLLAKAFRDIGYEVSLLSLDYGQPLIEVIDGITVFKTYKQKDGIPALRFIYPRMTSIVSALKKANAEIYYQSCAGMLTGTVAWFCHRYGRKFIFRLASDSDCVPGKQIIRLWRDRKIYEYGLRWAHLIAAQSENQVALLRKNYQLASVPVNMAVQLPKPNRSLNRNIDVLWVNNIRELKRPELAVKLAAMLPDWQFTMIGGATKGCEVLYENVKSQVSKMPNVHFYGPISYHEIDAYFARARVFINTSNVEGFPNSFLQAWVQGVPVVSFFDPDGLIAKKNLGAAPSDIESMARIVSGFLKDETTRVEIGNRCRKYAVENYAPIAAAKNYEKLIGADQ